MRRWALPAATALARHTALKPLRFHCNSFPVGHYVPNVQIATDGAITFFSRAHPVFVIGVVQCRTLLGRWRQCASAEKLGGKFQQAAISTRETAIIEKEMTMITKTKTALIAALVLSSASVALADDAPYNAEKDAYLRNPNAPVPTYQQSAPAPQARGQLFEGRNVGVNAPAGIYQVPSEQRIWLDRTSTDFHS
jgi:hypothetical protein